MSQLLAGKVALVTGAGRGIGRATALAFAGDGAAVSVLDANAATAAAVAREIEDLGGHAHSIAADVRLSTTAALAARETVSVFGGIDVLVNNAGVERYGAVADLSEDDWDYVITTNLKAAWLLSKHVIPNMLARRGGLIVNVASVQAFVSERANTAYGVSKAGLLALARGIAVDYAADGIRAVCVAPGSVRTAMLEAAAVKAQPNDPQGEIAAWESSSMIGRLIDPQEVAALIRFLASNDSTAITGTTFVIDGGILAARGR